MAKQNLITRSANKIAVLFDGTQIGLVQSVRMSDDYGLEPASGIGDIHVQEHVPSLARHNIQVSSMTLLKGAMREAKLASENGDVVLKGLVVDICAYDKETGEELRKYSGCSYASGDVDIQAHKIVISNATFMALDVSGIKL